MRSVHKAQERTNRIASYMSMMHGKAGTMALACLRVRQGRDANVQALRDITAEEMKHWRKIERNLAA